MPRPRQRIPPAVRELGDDLVPALKTGAPVGWLSVAYDGIGLLGLVPSAIARLPFGIAERKLAL
jgi:hypothetical protein